MNKPTLVILAAGMGSRYGGMKQIDGVGSHGEPIIEFSIYDAKEAGFEDVVLSSSVANMNKHSILH